MDNCRNKCYAEYEYNDSGNMLKQRSVNAHNITSYTYDNADNMIQKTDGNYRKWSKKQ